MKNNVKLYVTMWMRKSVTRVILNINICYLAVLYWKIKSVHIYDDFKIKM